MALQEGADLVPILSLGECDLMDNIALPNIQVESYFAQLLSEPFPYPDVIPTSYANQWSFTLPTQQWFLKRVGFGIPHFPYGIFYLPIPRPRKITVVVGKPIPGMFTLCVNLIIFLVFSPHNLFIFPLLVCKIVDPSEAIVKETLDTYMRALLDMYERHREVAGERPNRKLVLMETRDKKFRFGNTVLKSS